MFTDEVELEADLGIDSVKQSELLAKIGERYHLRLRPGGLRAGEHRTMGTLTDLVLGMLSADGSPVAETGRLDAHA